MIITLVTSVNTSHSQICWGLCGAQITLKRVIV